MSYRFPQKLPAKIQRKSLLFVSPPLNNVKTENSFRRKDFDDEFWFINIKIVLTRENNY